VQRTLVVLVWFRITLTTFSAKITTRPIVTTHLCLSELCLKNLVLFFSDIVYKIATRSGGGHDWLIQTPVSTVQRGVLVQADVSQDTHFAWTDYDGVVCVCVVFIRHSLQNQIKSDSRPSMLMPPSAPTCLGVSVELAWERLSEAVYTWGHFSRRFIRGRGCVRREFVCGWSSRKKQEAKAIWQRLHWMTPAHTSRAELSCVTYRQTDWQTDTPHIGNNSLHLMRWKLKGPGGWLECDHIRTDTQTTQPECLLPYSPIRGQWHKNAQFRTNWTRTAFYGNTADVEQEVLELFDSTKTSLKVTKCSRYVLFTQLQYAETRLLRTSALTCSHWATRWN